VRVGVEGLKDDPYAWLERLDDPRVLEFVERHNRRLRSFLGSLPGALEPLVRRYLGVPQVLAYRATARGLYALVRDLRGYHVVRVGRDGVVELVSSRSLGRDYVITGLYARPDGGVIAYKASRAGSDESVLRVVDAESLEVIDEVSGYVYDVVWTLRGDSYYYVRGYRSEPAPDGVEPPAWRVFERSPGAGEELVFGAGLPSRHMVSLTEPWEEGWVFATVWRGWVESRVYAGPRGSPERWEPVAGGGGVKAAPIGFIAGVPYVALYDGRGYGRIARYTRGGLVEVVGERPREPLDPDGLAAVGGRVYAVYLRDASSVLRAYTPEGSLAAEYRPSRPVTITMIQGGPRGEVYMLEEGFHQPAAVRVLEPGGGEARDAYAPGGRFDVEVGEDWCTSGDGTRIHLFIVRRRGSTPRRAVVYGYGGFAVPVTPFYPAGMMAAILDLNTALVVANIRGGGEYGEEWHRAGMRERKQNVFDDYRAALDYARRRGWRTIGWGASNGGLLVAAALTQYPELLDAALIGYPLTDMLRFHLLGLGRLWTTEYGDPEDPRDRRFLEAYSPYHNVRPGARYPPTLIYTGLHDDRVHPAHAFKLAARLEEVGAPVYLRTEMESGHSGAAPDARLREYADLLAFIEKTVPGR
jgi:prolyl oligopeptidase